MSETTTTGGRRKAFRTAGIILASLVGLILVALLAVYFLAEPLAERYLKKQVAEQTDGLYQLDFRELDLSLHTWGITLHELHFYPDTTVHQQQKAKGLASRSLFEVKSPKLQVTGIHLLDLLFNDRFQVGKVLLERPTITHLLDEAVEESISKGDKNGGALDAVRIREIDLQEASYRYQVLGQPNPQHAIPSLSLQVEDLRLDLQAEQELSERLQAAALALDVRGYTYQAPDSVYTIRVGRFSYATSDQELKAENVLVQPDIRANEALPKDKAHRTVYQFSTPLLRLQGMDVTKAWETGQLQLDQLVLAQSSLQVHEDLSVPDTDASPALEDLYAEYATYLREISIQELHLATDSFSYHQKSGTTHMVHRLAQASLRLEDLQLDSATLFTPKEKAFAAAVSISTGTYTYSPKDSPYTLQAGNMQLSSRDKTLQADALHLVGDWRKNDRLKSQNKASRTFYDVKLPQLRFLEMDLLQAIRTSHLAIGAIEVEQPVIDVRTDRMVAKKEDGLDLEELYEQLSGVMRSLEVGEISVRDAAFTQHSKTRSIQRLQELEHAGLTATGLQLDSAFVYNKDKILPLQDISLKARNYRYRLPDNTYTFALGDLAYSTRRQVLTANSVDVISSLRANERQKLLDNASRKLFDLSATTLQITGLDIIRGLNSGRLEADLLLLRQPNVTMLLDRQVAATPSGQQEAGAGIFELVDVVAVKTIRLEDGSFTLNEKLVPVMRTHLLEHATATVSSFELTPAGLANLDNALPMEELTLLATDYTYQSTDSLYTFRLDSLHYSSRQQELVARTFSVQANRDVNERLKAENMELASHNLIDIEAKKTRISGFDLIRAYATGQYHMDKLLLAGPEVTILQDHNVPPGTKNEAESVGNGPAEELNEMVSTFRVEQVQVRDGTFDFEILQDTTRMSHTLAHVALSIDKLQLVSLEANDPLDIFDVEDIEVLVQGYTFFLPDSLYALEIKQLSASMQNRLLLVDSVHLKPLFSKEEYADRFTYAHDRFDMYVPGVALHGISLRALFNSQDLVAHKMVIRNPEVEIYRDNSIGLDPDNKPPTLQRMLREAGMYIRLDTILVDKKNLVHPVIAINAIKPGVLRLEDIHLELFNVTNDTTLIRSNNVATANMSALFMGASTLQARFAFELDHPEDRYTYEGSLDAMDFTALNPLFENMVFVRIKSGQIGDARFSVEAVGEMATGMLHFPYTNLKVQLLNKHDPENPGFLLKVGTRLVNTLIIKKNNPSAWGNFREGHVKEERDPQRAVFHHMGQSLQDGVVSSLMTRLVERIVSVFVDI